MLLDMRFTPYAPRTIRSRGVIESGGHRIKVYTIAFGERSIAWETFEPALASALGTLPPPAPERGRPGLGFVVAHQGRTGDYLVLGSWDRENELSTQVFVRDAGSFRAARDGESFCVWDLEVVWHERCAYVASLLAKDAASPEEAYLSSFLTTPRA